MSDRISLVGLRVEGRHGVTPDERSHPQPFLVDIEARADLSGAAASDALADTVDYADLARRVHAAVAGESCHLLESLAARVVEVVLEDRRVVEAMVTIHKPEAPLPVDVADVSVTLRRTR